MHIQQKCASIFVVSTADAVYWQTPAVVRQQQKSKFEMLRAKRTRVKVTTTVEEEKKQLEMGKQKRRTCTRNDRHTKTN